MTNAVRIIIQNDPVLYGIYVSYKDSENAFEKMFEVMVIMYHESRKEGSGE